MVCIYCGQATQVTNSRHQRRINHVWRRRQCAVCKAVFTTLEGPDMQQAFRVSKNDTLEPFSRDKLLFSIHDSLRHRETALSDATGLTDTILNKLYGQFEQAIIQPERITRTALDVLSNFDAAAATHYRAFHPS